MATAINRPPLGFISSLFLCVLLFGHRGFCKSVPGMYIFGDSLVDVGNNNYLPRSISKANFPPYGVDFPTGKATGRFSNGKNVADFLAEKVGLPVAPPYLSLATKSKKLSSDEMVTGVSFASGGAGIFKGTGKLVKQSISLTKQVGYFSLVHDQLVQQLGSDEAQSHFSKSLFLLVIGSNDLFSYFNKNSKVSKEYTPQQYVNLMVTTLKGLLKRLYKLGARKFVLNGIGAIGCAPVQRKQNTIGECNIELNFWSMKYNDGLKALIEELKTESPDIHYSYFNTYRVMDSIIQNHKTYGITKIKEACCGDFPCTPDSSYCSNRKNYLFWDLYHPCEYPSSILADLIYNRSQLVTTPLNVEQLVNV